MIILGPSNTILAVKNQQEKKTKASGSKSSSKNKGKERIGILHMITIGPSIDVLLDKSQPDRTLLKRKAKDRATSKMNEGPSNIDDVENDEEVSSAEEDLSSDDDQAKKKKKKSTVPIHSDVVEPPPKGNIARFGKSAIDASFSPSKPKEKEDSKPRQHSDNSKKMKSLDLYEVQTWNIGVLEAKLRSSSGMISGV